MGGWVSNYHRYVEQVDKKGNAVITLEHIAGPNRRIYAPQVITIVLIN